MCVRVIIIPIYENYERNASALSRELPQVRSMHSALRRVESY